MLSPASAVIGPVTVLRTLVQKRLMVPYVSTTFISNVFKIVLEAFHNFFHSKLSSLLSYYDFSIYVIHNPLWV